MPVSEEKAWEWARGQTCAEAFPIHQGRFNVGMVRKMYSRIFDIMKEFEPASTEQHSRPLFAHLSDDPAVQFYIEDLTTKHAEWDNRYKNVGPHRSASSRETGDPALRRGLGHFLKPEIHLSNPLYGFQQLMFHAPAAYAMWEYANGVLKRMMESADEREEKSFDTRLWIGFRDWVCATALARGLTFLAAKAYQDGIEAAYARKQERRRAAAPSAQQSVGHSVYEARARRSAQGEVRARWA